MESVQKLGRLAETATHAFCGAPVSCGVRRSISQRWEKAMRLIIEARLADGDSDTVNDGDGVLAVVERRD
jgi:hypothetical protein